MLTHARWLMGTAALFNWSVVFGFLFLNGLLTRLLDLAPSTGTNLAMRDLALVLIATFGAAYLYAAFDPLRGRPYIALGILGKALVALAMFAHWALGNIGWQLPALVMGDVIYSLLFIHFLRRH
ncbi:hypothetical protein M8R19_30185 [Pseudomonas sp. R3.Fl]|uniref:hypothetical protein n=1 Tax=Pseudomonas TaxID=286 RepID=UPI00201D9215|nr:MULTISPECIES: hypothetical protein [Pseudomonas]ELM7154777.1 hypothetical protein [Pseudomonas aeruginosa]MCL6692958.1 hypothetical protein [Pseudomonas sp. R3.Fl]MDI4074135.1 hypothetical protein [Pseudomonas aeruginosa]MED5607883.1 hypothetical protein [Pseudomonas sp. JH-2]UUC52865.1 hypothetical protein NOX82_13445 [Pseudomonas citronellolis]